MIGATRELNCFSAHIRLRELGKSEDKAEAAGELDCFSAHIRLRESGKSEDKAEYKATDSRAMSLTDTIVRRGGTFME
ncbi:hypothetical protein B296_00018777 [Ensete ventricosum]|uniref:Uncharacterized protein n=1 Tax=Ensete ventricosum TaxID=4639 RepID=A0A426YKG6_ENSVE|nr:hypothetical protein B296_00018777 [Ensete ventricosum]